jgi:tRNA G18 (ribose-2'-O)-methylase SpoU
MPRIELENLDDARLRVFSRMTDSELRDPKQLVGLRLATGAAVPEEGLFIAESRNVIERAMGAGLTPFALLSDKRWEPSCEELFACIEAAAPAAPLFVGTHQQVFELTGYERTRGPLAAFHRPTLPTVQELLKGATRVAVLEDVTNFTNIGAIFRSAAALGMNAVLVTPGCHDPLYRRANRVSMGTVFQVPWTRIGADRDWAEEGVPLLNKLGFTVAALALEDNSIALQDPQIAQAEKLALVLGTEGDGLAPSTIASCNCTVKIPMAHNVDSLNVAAASAVAFWQVRGQYL